MNDIELRWQEQVTGKTLMNEWGYYYPETRFVLQYRRQIRSLDYSSDPPCEISSWDEWQTVPEIRLPNSV